MDEAIDVFLSYLNHERRSSRSTLRCYGEDLAMAATFLEDQGLCSWEEAQYADLRRLVVFYQSQGHAPATIGRRLAALRSFYAFMVRQGKIASSPAAALKGPRLARSLP